MRTIAALHQQDGALRVLVGRIEGVAQVRILAAEAIAPMSAATALPALAERVGGVDLVVRVLPPGATVARVVPLPAVPEGEAELDGEAIADALSLMTETDLPSAIPTYRRAAGVIRPGRGAGQQAVGLLTAWPTPAMPEGHGHGAPSRIPRIAREACISESAALAVLAQALGGVERAWTIDRQGGAMTILAAGDKTVIRVVRFSPGERAADAQRTALAEASRAAGLAPDEPPADERWLTLQPAPESPRLLGETRSRDWIGQYGLAAAALAAFADRNPAVAGLVGLHETEPKAKPPIVQRVSEWAGQPRRAAVIGVACLLLAIGVPIGASVAKVYLLEKQIKNEKELVDQNAKDDLALRFANALKQTRLPMTQILADIAGACPVGVTIDSIDVAQGSDPVMIRGLASDSEKLNSFRSKLDQTRLFSEIATPMNNPGEKGVQFQITAKIIPGAPLSVADKPAEDFVTTPLSVRLYGESARGASTPAHSTSRSERSDRSSRDRRTNGSSGASSRTTSRETSRDSGSRTERPSSKPAAIPPPLSDAEIARLSRDQAMLEWTKRLAASKQPGLDDATKQRLTSESDKAKARMNAASGGGQ
ncbi:MAG TPA: PilN domain-containing protein [Phycisphaerales bacterium]|nr:PilN domain-containing protein [Phycisphaerales bacterium]